MNTKKKYRLWRWLGLASILITFIFNYLSLHLNIGVGSIAEITAVYRNYFTPAGYAFTIWGVIYLSFLVYAIYQLLPSQKEERFYDVVSTPFVFVNLLGIVWQVAFRNNLITLSLLIIISMLILGIRIYTCMKTEQLVYKRSYMFTVPFSLFLGWISVATIANVSVWLVFIGYSSTITVGSTISAIMLMASLILGITVGAKMRDFVFPLVVAWGCMGIWMRFSYENVIVAGGALFTGVALAVSGIFIAFWHFWLRKALYNRHGHLHPNT